MTELQSPAVVPHPHSDLLVHGMRDSREWNSSICCNGMTITDRRQDSLLPAIETKSTPDDDYVILSLVIFFNSKHELIILLSWTLNARK